MIELAHYISSLNCFGIFVSQLLKEVNFFFLQRAEKFFFSLLRIKVLTVIVIIGL